MRVQVESPAQLVSLTEWLFARGWPVVEPGDCDAEILVPWDQDEFAAALKLRADVAAWRAAHGGTPVSVDAQLWAPAPRPA